MARIEFPVSSSPGSHGQEGAGRIVNGRAIKTEQGAPSPFKWIRSGGLRQILNITGHSHCRGSIAIGSTLLVVLDERVYAVTESAGVFTATNLGALAGTDAVTIARNNAATPNIVAFCEAGIFNLFTNSAPTSFADGDLPASVAGCSANGYIVAVTGGGEIWSTALNAVTVGSDAFTNAQSNPDGLLRPVWFRGELFAFGNKTIEVFEETGDDPFPFRNKKISIPCGLIGTHAVAGFEEGWVGQLIWAAEDDSVRLLSGYDAKVISNEDVSRAIKDCADRSLLEACVYMDGQNAIWSLTSPGEWTWEYNATTGQWNEGQSYGVNDRRIRHSVRAFDRWIVGDDATGLFAEIDPDYHFEYGDPLIWELRSGSNASFPYPVEIPAAFFNFVAALGSAPGSDPIETTPKVMISWSLDGGYRYGNELTRELGRQGEGSKLVRVNGLGTTRSKGIRFRLRISDPVDVVFFGGEMPDVKARAA
jgi:hypothetical protein